MRRKPEIKKDMNFYLKTGLVNALTSNIPGLTTGITNAIKADNRVFEALCPMWDKVLYVFSRDMRDSCLNNYDQFIRKCGITNLRNEFSQRSINNNIRCFDFFCVWISTF